MWFLWLLWGTSYDKKAFENAYVLSLHIFQDGY